MPGFVMRESDYQMWEVFRLQNRFQTGRLKRRESMQGLLTVALTSATAVLTSTRDVQAQGNVL
jgi:hypothetical protein